MKVLNFNDPYIDSKGNVNDLGNMLSGELASQLVTNLLNPTLRSQVFSGIIVTANGDNTYTLNNAVITAVSIPVNENFKLPSGKIKLTGCIGGSEATHFLYVYDGTTIYKDYGNGVEFIADSSKTYSCYIQCRVGASFSNTIYKPMLTTNLSATYNDFVPYTGTTGTLNGDVAELAKNTILTREYDITISSITKNTGVNQKVTDTLKNDIGNGHFLGAMCHVGNTTTLTGVCVYSNGNTLSIYVKNESTAYDYTDVVLHVTVFYKI